MQALKSLIFGLFGGFNKAVSTFALYITVFVFSTITLIPLNNGFHATFDRMPAAIDFTHGRGLDLLFSNQGLSSGFWASSFGLLLPSLIVFAIFCMWLEAGIYGLAAGEDRGFRALARAGSDYFWGFMRLFLLNAILWSILTAILGVIIVKVGKAFYTDNHALLGSVILVETVLFLIIANLARNSIGFAQARWVVKEGREGTWQCFIRAFLFTLRRLIPVNFITWSFCGLRAIIIPLLVVKLAPGFDGGWQWFMTATFFQLAFLFTSYMRVAEARAQVQYTHSFVSMDRF